MTASLPANRRVHLRWFEFLLRRSLEQRNQLSAQSVAHVATQMEIACHEAAAADDYTRQCRAVGVVLMAEMTAKQLLAGGVTPKSVLAGATSN